MLINTNIITIGNSTKNHDILLYPALHNVSRIHVQNNIYSNLLTKTYPLLDIGHE